MVIISYDIANFITIHTDFQVTRVLRKPTYEAITICKLYTLPKAWLDSQIKILPTLPLHGKLNFSFVLENFVSNLQYINELNLYMWAIFKEFD